MPTRGVLVEGVEGRLDPALADRSVRIGVARNVPALAAAGAAGRDLRDARVAAQVDVQLTAGGAAARLLPDEALEVAPVGRDGVDVVPAVADRADQRIGQPGRAIDRRLDPLREALPARQIRADGLPRRCGGSSLRLLRLGGRTA